MDWLEKLQQHKIDMVVVVLIVLGVVIAALGLRKEEPKVEYISGGQQEEKIWVDVGGGVVSPGVYELSSGQRVKDALVAAGGLSGSADREYVAKMINMADKISDGQKIYIPLMNTPGSKVTQSVDKSDNPGGVLINVNTASQSQLDSLWGVGSERAKAIIDNRPYKTVDELVSKKVLPKNVVEKNKTILTVY